MELIVPYQPPRILFLQFLANGLGCVAAIFILPVFLLIKLVMMPFEKPKTLSAEQVVDYLKGFIDGTDGDGDWDNFTTQPIADPRLDDIRDRVAAVDIPLIDSDLILLKALLAEAGAIAAENLAEADQSTSSSRP